MLQASNISKHYGDALLLQSVSFTINAGDRAGLIGPNRCGRSTLLRIFVGQEKPDAGSVSLDPPDLEIGYLEQGLSYSDADTLDDVVRSGRRALAKAEAEVARLAAALAANDNADGLEASDRLDAYGEALARMIRLVESLPAEHEVSAALAGLDLGHLPLDTPVGHLSGGQKTRLGLARLLLRKYDLLLLDEPTNHLDIDALEWLESWLRDFTGAAIIVSHDRAFLDRTANWIYDLDEKTHTLTPYPGTYTGYLTTKQRELERH